MDMATLTMSLCVKVKVTGVKFKTTSESHYMGRKFSGDDVQKVVYIYTPDYISQASPSLKTRVSVISYKVTEI